MKKNYRVSNNKLIITFDFNEEYIRTLLLIKSNNEYVSFKNRDMFSDTDLDGNDISWKVCDDLVDMGLLMEDEESYYVTYIINEYGNKVINMLSK